jgi:hypothetical protein
MARTSRPVGVGTLMYVGDVASSHNDGAMLLCTAGIVATAYGLLAGNKKARNYGAIAAIAGFITL